jgi:hypothetical protein
VDSTLIHEGVLPVQRQSFQKQLLAISSWSDCFTVNNLVTSNYNASCGGPENYSDTALDPNGTAKESG